MNPFEFNGIANRKIVCNPRRNLVKSQWGVDRHAPNYFRGIRMLGTLIKLSDDIPPAGNTVCGGDIS